MDCRCESCGHVRTVWLTGEQALRLSLDRRPADPGLAYPRTMPGGGCDHVAVSLREEAQPLDVMVELISRVDGAADETPRVFYDRLCEGLCELTSMTRAGLLLYDDLRKLVLPAGSHGVEPWLLDQVHGTLEETPVAQTALSEDRVVVVSDDLAEQIPARYAELGGFTTLTCTPVSAGGRWLGVIFADRGGGPFDLTDTERRTMWTLGKTAALAASVRTGTTEHERSRLLAQRVDVAREVHDRVMQRLFGVSLVLGSDIELGRAERARAAEELQDAVADLRTVLARSPEARARAPRRHPARRARPARAPLRAADRARLAGRPRGAGRAGRPEPGGPGRGAAQRRQARAARRCCGCAWPPPTARSCSR